MGYVFSWSRCLGQTSHFKIVAGVAFLAALPAVTSELDEILFVRFRSYCMTLTSEHILKQIPQSSYQGMINKLLELSVIFLCRKLYILGN